MKTWWRRQTELDEYQTAAIGLPIDGNFLVSGPPGSGKTNILVLRAQYLHSAGYTNVNLIVYGRVLKEFIVTGCGDPINFPSEQVFTFAAWVRQFIRIREMELPEGLADMDEPESRAALFECLDEATKGLRPDFFDSLIIDEVQDLTEGETEILSRLTERLFMGGDQRQKIFENGQGLDAVRSKIDLAGDEIVLPHHYRIGPAICEAADRIKVDNLPPLSATANYQDDQFPSRVNIHQLADFDAQCLALVETITTQLRGYGNEFIGVVCTRNNELERVHEILSGTSLADKIKLWVMPSRAGYLGDTVAAS